jgi:alanyl-tRNA synthetase
MFTSQELITKYLEFFVGKGHVVIPSASLVPTNDPSVLFTTAGMHPLVPHLLGEPHVSGTRLVNVQRCVRTGDIDEIGDDTHLTYFEMLGNWSLGDYFRTESIRWSFELLTTVLGLPPDRLGVTCFAGDDQVPRDDDSVRIWRSLGIDRIRLLGRDDNWWGPAGTTGPCGPDTEIFLVDGDRWVEIWNNVFMGYTKQPDGSIVPLSKPNVDTGMGLERTLMALNGFSSVYEVDTVFPLYRTLRDLTDQERPLRILVDHLRASSQIITDGVEPSNKGRGYVLRRLIRRCGLFAKQLGLPRDWYACVDQHRVDQDRVDQHRVGSPQVVDTIGHELERFDKTLVQGLKVLNKLPSVDGKMAFDLFQTYGFPFELTRELAGNKVDHESFREAFEIHRTSSRGTPSETP